MDEHADEHDEHMDGRGALDPGAREDETHGDAAPEDEARDAPERLRRELAVLRAENAAMRREAAGRGPAADRRDARAVDRVLAAAEHARDRPAGDLAATVALPRGEERLRAIVESAVDYAIITADIQGRITSWNKGASRLLGWEEADAMGRPLRLIFSPADCAAGVPQAEMRRALEDGRAMDERWHIRRDGSRFWGVGELLPLHDGVLLGYLKILRDSTEQRRAQEALRENEQRYRLIVESAVDYAIFTTDLEGRITSWNRGAREVLGWDETEALGRPNAILYTPEDHAAGVPEAEMAEALAEGRAEHDRWHLRADGSRIWGTEVVTPLRDGGGEARGFLKILRDRTAQKREEEQRRLLLAELNHRVKNTLAVVQSLIAQTAPGAADAAVLRGALEARLDALACAHDLLTREAWRGAGLAQLVRATLAPYAEAGAADPARLLVRGPEVHLKPNAALALHMALHELAANAAKHGALSVPGGRVEVAWSLDRPAPGVGPGASGADPAAAPGGGVVLGLLWRERGGPPVAPPSARGFGSRLIEDTLPYQLGGNVRLTFEEQGLECRFVLPLSDELGRA